MDERNALERLIDLDEIRDVLARYCSLLDEFRLDELLQLFAEDCVTDYGPGRGGRGMGRALLRNMIETSMENFQYTHHQLGQVLVEISGNEASSIAYVTADHRLVNGARETIRMQYRDKLRKTGGKWQICFRETRATIVDAERFVERVMLERRSSQRPARNPG